MPSGFTVKIGPNSTKVHTARSYTQILCFTSESKKEPNSNGKSRSSNVDEIGCWCSRTIFYLKLVWLNNHKNRLGRNCVILTRKLDVFSDRSIRLTWLVFNIIIEFLFILIRNNTIQYTIIFYKKRNITSMSLTRDTC